MKKEEFEKLSSEDQQKMLSQIEGIQEKQKQIADEEAGIPKMSMDAFKDIINNAVEKNLSKLTPTDKKYHMFPGAEKSLSQEEINDQSSGGRFKKTSMFLNAMINKDAPTLNAMHQVENQKANLSEGTSTAGGHLVPEEFKAEILRLAPLYGVIRQNCRIIPMKYDVVNIPAAGTTDNSAIWTNEAAQILNTHPTFDQVTLTINKLAALPKLTNELLADANVEIVQYLAMIIAEAFAKEEDNQAFNGTGSPFVGTLNSSGVPISDLASASGGIATLSYSDLVQATGNLYTNALSNAKFYFHRSVGAQLRSRITTTGAPILGPSASDLAGYPFVLTEMLPSTSHASAASTNFKFAMFGDLRRGFAMGERGSLTMKMLEEGTVGGDNLGEKDMVALRVIERVAQGVLLPSAWTNLRT